MRMETAHRRQHVPDMPDPVVRPATAADSAFLSRALKACGEQQPPLTLEGLLAAIAAGDLAYFLVDRDGRTVCGAGAWLGGDEAWMGFLYREAEPPGLKDDIRLLLGAIVPYFKRLGARRVVATVASDSPNRERLIRFYGRFMGFVPLYTTLGTTVDRLAEVGSVDAATPYSTVKRGPPSEALKDDGVLTGRHAPTYQQTNSNEKGGENHAY